MSGFEPVDRVVRQHGVAEIRNAVIQDPDFISFCCVAVFDVDISQGNPAPRLSAEQLRVFQELLPSSLQSHTTGLFRGIQIDIEPLIPGRGCGRPCAST